MVSSSASASSLQILAADARPLGVLPHVGDRGAVLAQQPLERGQPLFDGLESAAPHSSGLRPPGPRRAPLPLPLRFLILRLRPRGLVLQPLAVAAQIPGEVAGLDRERTGALGQRVELGVGAGDPLQTGGRLGAQRGGAGRVVSVGALPTRERLGRLARGGEQRVELAQALALGAQPLGLPLPRRGLFDLGELVLEQVELPLTRVLQLAQLLRPLAQLPHLPVGGGAGGAAGGLLGAAVAVEDLQLRGGKRQLAVLVLAVEREQRASEPAQVRDGDGTAVDLGAGTPVGADAAGEHDLLGVGGQQLAALDLQRLGKREHPLDVRLGGAGPHEGGRGSHPRAPAEQQVERVREHGLAGARLAGEHVQPVREPQLGPLDQQQVLDAQLVYHARRCISGHRRIARARQRTP